MDVGVGVSVKVGDGGGLEVMDAIELATGTGDAAIVDGVKLDGDESDGIAEEAGVGRAT